MKLMNISQRKFILSGDKEVKPMDIVEVDDVEGTSLYEGYSGEWKIVEAPKMVEEKKDVEVKAEEPNKKKRK